MEVPPSIVAHPHYETLKKAADAIKQADAILIGSGAGMGVDSGLGTFRGRNAGVWPPLERKEMDFTEMSNPVWFHKNPNFGWAFWHFRYTAYTGSEPHEGYTILKDIASSKRLGGFCYTSNIDGHWIASGFSEDSVVECHGSVRYMQCTEPCNQEIWPTQDVTSLVLANDEYVNDPLPACITCKQIARPNVLMFGDNKWIHNRCSKQEQNYRSWKQTIQNNKLVVIEIGAGTTIPTVRWECEQQARIFNAPLIRLNLDDSSISRKLKLNGISIPMGVLEALNTIKLLLNQ